MKGARKRLRLSEEECTKMMIRLLSQKKKTKRWDSVEDPVVPVERNHLYGHPPARLMGKKV